MNSNKQNAKYVEDFILTTIAKLGEETERNLDALIICGEMQGNPPAYYKRLTDYNFDSISFILESILIVLWEDQKITHDNFIQEFEKRILYYLQSDHLTLDFKEPEFEKQELLMGIDHWAGFFNLMGINAEALSGKIIIHTKTDNEQ